MTVTAKELATRIVNRLDNEHEHPSREDRIKIVTEEVEKIFRMAEATIRDTLSKVRVSDD